MEHFEFSSVFDGEGYETPLGLVKTAAETARLIAGAGGGVKLSERGHVQSHLTRQEHALEVQIPFLQRSLESFNIVPVVMGAQSWDLCADLGRALAPVLDDPGTVIVASTDLSHFHAASKAEGLDRKFCDFFESLDARKLHNASTGGDCEACGTGPVVAALVATESIPGRSGTILKYANSGDVTGDYKSVVGYMSAVITSSA
jgi:AmmeMemoRadiSam system protein B